MRKCPVLSFTRTCTSPSTDSRKLFCQCQGSSGDFGVPVSSSHWSLWMGWGGVSHCLSQGHWGQEQRGCLVLDQHFSGPLTLEICLSIYGIEFSVVSHLRALEISCILLILSAPSLSLGPLSTLFPFPFLSQLRENKLFGCSLCSLCILSSVRHHTQVCRRNKGLLRMSMSYTPESIAVLFRDKLGWRS